MKRKTKRGLFFLLMLMLVIGAFVFVNLTDIERWMYPIEYKQEIEQHASKYDLNPLLVAAIIRSESNYKPHLVSDKGAIGLMQLMPETANWAADKMGIVPPTAAQLHDVETNIAIGTWYMDSLHKQFAGNDAMMIAAYNAGPTNVRKWQNDGVWDGRFDTSLDIPFGETRHYMNRVQKFYTKYETLYGTGLTLND
jgi:soluble lytic murein transglycosylase